MKSNKRGIVQAAVVLWAVCAFLGGILLWHPATSMLGISNQPRKTNQTMIKKAESAPVLYYTDSKGNKYVAYATKSEESTLATSEEPKLSFWQKIMNLGSFGIFLVILGLVFPPFGAVLWVIWQKVSAGLKTAVNNANTEIQTITSKHTQLSSDAKLIVKSVDAGLAEFDKAIGAAQASIATDQAAIQATASIVDGGARNIALTLAQNALATHQAVLTSVSNLKSDFKDTMAQEQNTTTKQLVNTLQNS